MIPIQQVRIVALLGVIGLLACASSGVARQPDQLQKMKAQWRESLSKLFSTTTYATVVDIPIEVPPPTTFSPGKLQRFLVSYGRSATFTPSLISIRRDEHLVIGDIFDTQSRLIAGLGLLDPSLLERATTEGVKLSELPSTLQSAIIEYAEIGGSLREAYTAGFDPLLRLYEAPTARFRRPSDGQIEELGLGRLYSGTPAERARLEKLNSRKVNQSIPEDEKLKNGSVEMGKTDFDFGDGEVLSAYALNIRLKAFPKCYLRFDSRFIEQPIFVKGKMSAKDLSTALKSITTAETPSEAQDYALTQKAAFKDILSLARKHTDLDSFYGLDGLKKEDYQGGAKIEISQLFKLAPDFKTAVGSKYSFPVGAEARFSSMLGLSISVPGWLPPPGGNLAGGTYLIRP